MASNMFAAAAFSCAVLIAGPWSQAQAYDPCNSLRFERDAALHRAPEPPGLPVTDQQKQAAAQRAAERAQDPAKIAKYNACQNAAAVAKLPPGVPESARPKPVGVR